MKNKISILLFLVLLVSNIIPSSLIFYIFKQMALTQEEIYKNKNLEELIENYESTLKKISKLDPNNEQLYKNNFLQLQDQKLVYGQDRYFSDLVQKAITKSFLIYLSILTLTTLFLGFALSYFINKSYMKLFSNLEKEKERTRYLQETSKWQEVARNLAHEVKKPLQPMRFWLSNLNNLSLPIEARSVVSESTTAIEAEINSIHQFMDNFKEFSVLPKPHFEKVDLNDFITNFIQSYNDLWENVIFKKCNYLPNTFVNIDSKLIRNVFVNIIENASEANPLLPINISLKLEKKDRHVEIMIHNSGAKIAEELIEKIFEINFSTKESKKNMGLGLAIAKVTILEHFGDIKCISIDSGAMFLIKLPLYIERNISHV